MEHSEKINELLSTLKTSNEIIAKQQEITKRVINLINEYFQKAAVITSEQVEPETIKPEDMKAGEWYVVKSWYDWIFKFKKISGNQIITFKHASLDGEDCLLQRGLLTELQRIKSIRKATQEEIIKYFPNELEVPTHGGNDAAYIQEVTDKQL